MYREKPRGKCDSGWVFFSGTEDQAYADDPSNFVICALTTVAEIDPDVAGYLDLPPPCAFERERDDQPFRESVGFRFEPE